MGRVLVACEFSGTVRDAFIARGHDAMSADLLPTEKPGPHHEGDVLDVLDGDWDLVIAHPPCTYLTNAGVRHLHDHIKSRNGNQTSVSGSKRWVEMFEGAMFFREFLECNAPRVCIENPIPHMYARGYIGKYNQLIQPWMFGHGETKATCLWLRNLPNLEPTNIVDGREGRIHKMPPGPDRWKKRSVTYQGIADAMAAQWGELI